MESFYITKGVYMFRANVNSIGVCIDDSNVEFSGICKKIRATVRKNCYIMAFLESRNIGKVSEVNLSDIQTFKESCDIIVKIYINLNGSLQVKLMLDFLLNGKRHMYDKSETISQDLFTKEEFWLDSYTTDDKDDEKYIQEYYVNVTKLMEVFFNWDEEKNIWYYEYNNNAQFCDYISRLINLSYNEMKIISKNCNVDNKTLTLVK